MPMVLVPLEHGEPIKLDKAILFFGRHPDCDVVLTNSRKVSRKHCCVAQIDSGIVVRDVGSMNGVRVNDDVSRDELPIRPGDVLWVGDVGYRMEMRAAEQRKPRKPSPEPESTAAVPRNATLNRSLSGDEPVPLAEEGKDFSVERTLPPRKKKPADSEVIELSESDIMDDDTTYRA